MFLLLWALTLFVSCSILLHVAYRESSPKAQRVRIKQSNKSQRRKSNH